ncbi:MAG: glycosyltransferase 87 family protein [Terriglobales bacterium]
MISIVVSGRQMFWYMSHGPVFTDLRIFMTGVKMVGSGAGHQLYNFDAQRKAQTELYPETRASGLLPFNHLAYELLLYWPISGLSYRTALLVWALVNVGLLFALAWLLAPYSRNLTRAAGAPLALCFLAFYPVMYVLGEGQDSLVFTLLLVLSLRAMDAGSTFLAGFLLAFACFKFHLALLIAFFVLLLRARWRGMAGFVCGGVLVGGVSLAMVGPAILHDYPAMLRRQDVMTPWGFVPWFMPNLRGFLQWALAPWLDEGTILLVVFMCSAVVGVVAAWLVLRHGSMQDESMVYAVAILTAILISYHLHMQDLSMALLPMVFLAERAARGWSGVPAGGEAGKFSPSRLSITVLAAAISALYLYRIGGVAFPVLVVRGCFLAVPLFVLWVVALRWWTASPPSRIKAA